jgi:hypothetical protein
MRQSTDTRNQYIVPLHTSLNNAVIANDAFAAGDAEIFLYEFIGDLKDYDDPGLLSEDGDVVEHEGYKATELLTRALQGFPSMDKEEQDEVERLLKHIFDPSETVFAGRPFVHRWANGRTMDPILVFKRFTGAELFTNFIVRFRDFKSHDYSLVAFCLSYERLAPRVDVRVT